MNIQIALAACILVLPMAELIAQQSELLPPDVYPIIKSAESTSAKDAKSIKEITHKLNTLVIPSVRFDKKP